MKKVLLLLAFILIGVNSGRADWMPFETNFPWSLFDCSFYNSDTGLAVGEQGSILRTTDGASTWEVVHSVPGKWFNSVHMVTADTAYAVGTYGLISKTIDGGLTWSDTTMPGDNKHFRSIRALPSPNVDNVILVGYAGNMYKTLDGGITWIEDTSIPWTMHCIDRSSLGPNFIAIIAATDGRIYRSINDGSTWSFIDIRQSLNVYEYLNSVRFAGFGSVNAVIVGNTGRVLRTSNSGANWEIIDVSLATTQHLRDVDWRGSVVVAVGDAGTIIRSTDDGFTYFADTSNTTRHLYGISLVDGGGLMGYAVGEIGNGASAASFMADNLNINVGVTPISNVIPERYNLEQNYPNPFNPSTTIKFSIPSSSFVKLVVFDITGREVTRLVNENLSAGAYAYTFDAGKLNSGIYFYKLDGNGFTQTKKMILVK